MSEWLSSTELLAARLNYDSWVGTQCAVNPRVVLKSSRQSLELLVMNFNAVPLYNPCEKRSYGSESLLQVKL